MPRIAGQHEAYLVKALQEYKSGERSHPSMRAIAASLSDQDMADLAAYYAQGGVKTASEMTMPIADCSLVAARGAAWRVRRRAGRRPRRRQGQGRRKSARPATAPTATARRPTFPKLGGQHRDYLAKALRDYKSGQRKNPIMAGFAPGAVEAGHRESRRVLRGAAGDVSAKH